MKLINKLQTNATTKILKAILIKNHKMKDVGSRLKEWKHIMNNGIN